VRLSDKLAGSTVWTVKKKNDRKTAVDNKTM